MSELLGGSISAQEEDEVEEELDALTAEVFRLSLSAEGRNSTDTLRLLRERCRMHLRLRHHPW